MEENVKTTYLLFQVIIFLGIKYTELSNQPYVISGKLMYSCIVLNFVYMLYYFVRYQGEIKIPLALAMTLVADYYLTLTDTHFLLGVFCFFLVQVIYGWKLGFTLANVFLRLVLLAVLVVLMHVLGMLWDLCIMCGLSFATLTVNVICSWRKVKKAGTVLNREDRRIETVLNREAWNADMKKNMKTDPKTDMTAGMKKEALMLAIGLTLFAGCDLSLGLRIISDGVAGLELFHAFVAFMVWVFYLPSQAILTLTYTEFCKNTP